MKSIVSINTIDPINRCTFIPHCKTAHNSAARELIMHDCAAQ
jgi:hypothetical protein